MWFGARIESISAAAASTAPLDFAWMTIWLSPPVVPVSRLRVVESGAIAMSSWSWMPFVPLLLSTPMTWSETPLTLTVWPTGFRPRRRGS